MTIDFDIKRNSEGKIDRVSVIETWGPEHRRHRNVIDLTSADVRKLLAELREDLAVLDGEFGLI